MAKKPKQTKDEIVSMWQDRIANAEGIRNDYKTRYEWEHFIEMYKGNWAGILPEGITPLNDVFSWAKTEISSLYLRDPHMEVTALKKATIQQAKIRELVLADIWRRKKLKKEVKKTILDALLVGHGWIKLGYSADFDTMLDAEGNELETITKEDFFGYRVPWKHVCFNPDAIDVPYDCKWIAHEFWVPLEKLKKKKGYKHVDKLSPQPLKRETIESPTASTTYPLDKLDETAIQYVQLYEIHDLENKQIMIMAKGLTEGFVHEKEWPYKKMKGLPFAFLNFNPINDEPYGVPDVWYWKGQLLEKMKMDHMIEDHVKKGNRQIASEPNNMLPESVKPYEEGEVGAVIEFRDVSKITTMPFQTVQPDVYPLRNIRSENIINTSGQSAQEKGGTQKTSTRTFSELALMDRGAKNRRSERTDLLEDFMEDISSKFVALEAEFADIPYYVRVTGLQPKELQQIVQSRPSAQQPGAITNQGANGGIAGFSATKEDLGGKGDEQFDVQIKAGSTLPLDRDTKLEMVKFLIEAAPKAGAIPGGPFVGTLAKVLIDEFDMPELMVAMEQEQKVQQQRQQAQAKQMQTVQQLQASETAADIQIKAEREGSRQIGNELKNKELGLKNKELNIKKEDLKKKAKQKKGD